MGCSICARSSVLASSPTRRWGAGRVQENAGAAEIELTAAEIARLDAANPPGIAAGERYPDEWMDEVNR